MLDIENGAFMEQLEEMAERKQWTALRDLLSEEAAADIADVLSQLPDTRLPVLYRLLPKELAAEVCVEMEPEGQELLIKTFSDTVSYTPLTLPTI